MISTAQRSTSSSARFEVGGIEHLSRLGQFDAVISMMTLEFIDQAAEAVTRLASAVAEHGVMVIAVHNPPYIKSWLHPVTDQYLDFDSDVNPRRGFMQLDGETKIPMYLRDADEYVSMANDGGMRLAFHEEPPFTNHFLANYPQEGPNQ